MLNTWKIQQRYYDGYDKTQVLCWVTYLALHFYQTDGFDFQNQPRDIKIKWLTKWSIMHIFNSSPPSAVCMQWTGLFGTKPLPKVMLTYCQLDL